MPAAAPLSVLVIDDFADAADALAHLLTVTGCDARAAFTACDAVWAVTAAPPDAIVIEMRMRSGTRYALSERIAAAVARRPVFVAMTTTPDPDGRSKAAGFAAHFVKADDDHRLLALLRKATAKRNS